MKREKKNYLLLHCKEQRKIYYSLKKYGVENHEFEIIEECVIEQLNEREKYWIKKLNTFIDGLNLTEGGDGGKRSKESIEMGRLKIIKPILQYDLQGNFLQEWESAIAASKFLNKNSNNINDCARGKYHSTYGFRWVYKKDNEKYINLKPVEYKKCGCKWTEDRRIKTKNSRKGEKRSKEYSEKLAN